MNHRRLRASRHVRELAATVKLNHRAFVQPIFVEEGLEKPREILGLAGVFVDTFHSIRETIAKDLGRGVSKFLLFPIPMAKGVKDFDFSFAISIVKEIKSAFGNDIWLACDVCLCSYTDHGHCGVLTPTFDAVDNHRSVMEISRYAELLAAAGADCIAPSDMMDGRIHAIRKGLDDSGYDAVSVMSYSAKFSSQFYGPFRDACHSSPQAGMLKDRKTYQISPANPDAAVAAAIRDEREGADFIMVKPAAHYLDVIAAISKELRKPIVAYHVSGEYAAIEALAAMGLVERESAHLEVWHSLVRAGSDVIISYAARDAKEWIEKMEL